MPYKCNPVFYCCKNCFFFFIVTNFVTAKLDNVSTVCITNFNLRQYFSRNNHLIKKHLPVCVTVIEDLMATFEKQTNVTS